VLAGGEAFRRSIAPCIAEHRQQDNSAVLTGLLVGAATQVERRLASSIRLELDGAIELMSAASDPDGLTGDEWAGVALFHAIAAEKLNRIDAALGLLDRLLAAPAPPELRLCAAFNRMVCVEKLDPAAADFAEWITDRGRRLSTGELVWTKAFNMELVRSARCGQPFRYAGLLDEAIAAELTQASTGFGKTILNWANYSGSGLDRATVGEIWRVAGRASVNVRTAMLSNLRAIAEDPALAEAIDGALEAGAAISHRSATVLRMLSGPAAPGG
jgi:hypothetical protein